MYLHVASQEKVAPEKQDEEKGRGEAGHDDAMETERGMNVKQQQPVGPVGPLHPTSVQHEVCCILVNYNVGMVPSHLGDKNSCTLSLMDTLTCNVCTCTCTRYIVGN